MGGIGHSRTSTQFCGFSHTRGGLFIVILSRYEDAVIFCGCGGDCISEQLTGYCFFVSARYWDTGIPVLVLGNKNDLPNSLGVEQLIEALGLKSISEREVCCYSVSCKSQVNIGTYPAPMDV